MRISDWSSDVCSSDLHIARGFQHQNEEEQNKDLRQEDDHRAHTVDDAVNQEGSHDPFRHLLRHKGSDGCKPAFNHPYGRFGPGKDCLKHDEKQRWPTASKATTTWTRPSLPSHPGSSPTPPPTRTGRRKTQPTTAACTTT